jgi:PAS domain S-box-containing protein
MLRIAEVWLTQHWGDLSLRNKGIAFLFLPVAALVLNGALSYQFNSERQNAQFWLTHTFKVQIGLQQIMAELSTVAIDCRAYKLTKDIQILREARKRTSEMLAGLDALKVLTTDNPKQQGRIYDLRGVIESRLQYLFQRAVADDQLPVQKELESQAEQRAILGLIDRMSQEEAALMVVRVETLTRMQNREVVTGAIAFLVGVVSGILGIWLFLTGIAQRISAIGKQVFQLAEGVQIERSDRHRDEIGLVCGGLELASRLLVEREQAIRKSNALVEETTQLGERRFHALVNATAQIVWIADENGRPHPASPELCALTDNNFKLFVRDGWQASIHPKDRAAVQALWADGLANRKSYECEFRLQIADGSYRDFQLRGVPVLEPNGNIREWIQMANDVTEKKRMAALRRQLAAIVESSDDAIFSITLDDIIASWNKGAEKVFGYASEEVLGHSVHMLTPGQVDDMDLDRKCIESGVAIKNDGILRRNKNGELITVALTVSPIYDGAGQITGVSKIARDVTAQKQAEELLQQQANLLEQAYEPMIAWESKGLIMYWNQGAQDLYGFDSQQAIGRNIHQLLQTRHPSPPLEIEQQLATQKVWIGELEHVTSQGLTITVESRQKRLELSDGRSLILECNHDVTLRKQAESAMRQMNETLERNVAERTRQLSEANAELEAFCYSVSHDLRAPLRSVEGFAKILVRDHGATLDETALNLLGRLRSATLRMGQLIEDLLSLSKISRAEIHRQSVDLSELAAAVVDDLSASHPERKVEVELEPGLTAKADPRLLRVALENLLGNAWKFTGKSEAPRISFGVSGTNGEGFSYYVRDNGAGFDMAFADQLFAPFQRLHAASEFEGTGIGLATVQRIIHRHDGRIWADSGPGKGATFFFTLG